MQTECCNELAGSVTAVASSQCAAVLQRATVACCRVYGWSAAMSEQAVACSTWLAASVLQWTNSLGAAVDMQLVCCWCADRMLLWSEQAVSSNVLAACVLLDAYGQCAADAKQAKAAVVRGWGDTVRRSSACRGWILASVPLSQGQLCRQGVWCPIY